MRKGFPLPDADEIRHWFDIDVERGVVTWRNSPRRGMSGKPAGFKRGGTGGIKHSVRVNGMVLLRENLVFFASHGRWPYPYVEHINGDTLDDRIDNLREVPSRPARFRRRSNTLPMGVRESRGKSRIKYQARIQYRKRVVYLGTFETCSEAAHAYQSKRRQFHG